MWRSRSRGRGPPMGGWGISDSSTNEAKTAADATHSPVSMSRSRDRTTRYVALGDLVMRCTMGPRPSQKFDVAGSAAPDDAAGVEH
jgi:hypothetical protein